MSEKPQQQQSRLAPQTLVVASLSSLAAAIFIHQIWQGGAILGAAITPIIVSFVTEALRKPVEVVSTRTVTAKVGGKTVEEPAVQPPPVVTDREEDRFGIWEAQKPTWRERLGGRRGKIALATGAAAFVIAALFLTSAELVLGGPGDGDRFRLLPVSERADTDRDQDADDPAAPGEQEREPTPDDPARPEQPQEPAPGTVPAPGETAPAPAPEQPPPTTQPPPAP